MISLTRVYIRNVRSLCCIIFFLAMVVGSGVLRAEQLGCKYECMLKQTAATPLFCCDESPAVHDTSRDCGPDQSNHRNSLSYCCKEGLCFDIPLKVKEAAAVNVSPVEPEASSTVAYLDSSSASLGHPASDLPDLTQFLPDTRIPIYLRTCVFLI